MATINFALPSNIAEFLKTNFPGVASTSESGSSTLSLEVPAFGSSSGGALPSLVVAGLNEAGIQIPAGVASGAPVALPENVQVGVAQYAPEGLVPQGPALEDENLAGAVSFAQTLSERASSFFQQAASGGPISEEQFATFASQQSALIGEYILGA